MYLVGFFFSKLRLAEIQLLASNEVVDLRDIIKKISTQQHLQSLSFIGFVLCTAIFIIIHSFESPITNPTVQKAVSALFCLLALLVIGIVTCIVVRYCFMMERFLQLLFHRYRLRICFWRCVVHGTLIPSCLTLILATILNLMKQYALSFNQLCVPGYKTVLIINWYAFQVLTNLLCLLVPFIIKFLSSTQENDSARDSGLSSDLIAETRYNMTMTETVVQDQSIGN